MTGVEPNEAETKAGWGFDVRRRAAPGPSLSFTHGETIVKFEITRQNTALRGFKQSTFTSGLSIDNMSRRSASEICSKSTKKQSLTREQINDHMKKTRSK